MEGACENIIEMPILESSLYYARRIARISFTATSHSSTIGTYSIDLRLGTILYWQFEGLYGYLKYTMYDLTMSS